MRVTRFITRAYNPRVSGRLPFLDQLQGAWRSCDSMLCVGLDPDPMRMPRSLGADGLLEFCRAIVDATARHVCAFKPQAAHFAALGRETELAALIEHIHSEHPTIPVILDAKRGDIGSTAALYAREAYERYGADAVTVNPYLGPESMEPFLAYGDRGVVMLCRTSNPGSAWLQNHPANDPVFLRVAAAARDCNQRGNVMLVAGATYPRDLARIREVVADMPLLVPGIGAQGGDLGEVIRHGMDSSGYGMAVNVSRSILYASAEADFAKRAALAAQALRDQILVERDRALKN